MSRKHGLYFIPFILLGLLAAAELGVTAYIARHEDVRHDRFLRENRHIYVLFVCAWTTFSLFFHQTFPFIIAIPWAAVTTILWLVAGILIKVSDCADFWEFDPARNELVNICSDQDNLYRAMLGLAWACFAEALILLIYLIISLKNSKELTWRHGIYGRNYCLKPRDDHSRNLIGSNANPV